MFVFLHISIDRSLASFFELIHESGLSLNWLLCCVEVYGQIVLSCRLMI